MLKKIREFLEEKGQGTVEYALILGFIAIIAVWMLTGSSLTADTKKNVGNADSVAKSIDSAYTAASAGS